MSELDTTMEPTESTRPGADPVPTPGAIERMRQRWSRLPSTGRVMVVVGVLIALGIVGELVGGRFFGWYTGRISSVDPLDEAVPGIGD